MPTTTLRLPDELKIRIARLTRKTGQSPHSMMLDAITQRVEQEELRAALHRQADARFAEMIENGSAIAWTDMRAWLQDRAAGKAVKLPRIRKWRK